MHANWFTLRCAEWFSSRLGDRIESLNLGCAGLAGLVCLFDSFMMGWVHLVALGVCFCRHILFVKIIVLMGVGGMSGELGADGRVDYCQVM